MHEKICIGAFSKKIKEGLKMKLNTNQIKRLTMVHSRVAKGYEVVRNIKLEYKGSELSFYTTDLDYSLKTTIRTLGGDKGIKVGFNSNYFIECLKVFEDSQVAISISWKSLPIEFTHSNTTCILMPIRINKEVK
jgi:DNA polymerase III sliding clamp (beta) subunit (PCNA family)